MNVLAAHKPVTEARLRAIIYIVPWSAMLEKSLCNTGSHREVPWLTWRFHHLRRSLFMSHYQNWRHFPVLVMWSCCGVDVEHAGRNHHAAYVHSSPRGSPTQEREYYRQTPQLGTTRRSVDWSLQLRQTAMVYIDRTVVDSTTTGHVDLPYALAPRANSRLDQVWIRSTVNMHR